MTRFRNEFSFEENYTAQEKGKLAKSLDVFDATPIMIAALNGEPVTREFFDKLLGCIEEGKEAIKVGGAYWLPSLRPGGKDITLSNIRIVSDCDVCVASFIVKDSDLMVEMNRPVQLATESELEEIRNRLTTLEGKA